MVTIMAVAFTLFVLIIYRVGWSSKQADSGQWQPKPRICKLDRHGSYSERAHYPIQEFYVVWNMWGLFISIVKIFLDVVAETAGEHRKPRARDTQVICDARYAFFLSLKWGWNCCPTEPDEDEKAGCTLDPVLCLITTDRQWGLWAMQWQQTDS